MLDSLCEYDRRCPDFLLTLLFLLNVKNEVIKQSAIHHLEILNLSSIMNSSLIRKFKKLYFKKKDENKPIYEKQKQKTNGSLNIIDNQKMEEGSTNLNNSKNHLTTPPSGVTNSKESVITSDDNDNSMDDFNYFNNKDYIPVPIDEICNSISEILQNLLKKFLLYIKTPSRFKEIIKSMDVSSLPLMNKKYNRMVTKEVKSELETNPMMEFKTIDHSCYNIDTDQISEDNRYLSYAVDDSSLVINRHPLMMMINPTTFDYIPSIIHFLKAENKHNERKAHAQQVMMAKMKKKEEEKQKEAERRNLYNKFMEERERKYKERLEQRRQRALIAAEEKKSESLVRLPSIPKNRKFHKIKSSARFGETHCSKCHPSRETVCYPFHPMTGTKICERCLRRTNQIDMHFRKMYKSIPYEIIQPVPFIESTDEKMNSRVTDIQKSILEAMEKTKYKQENRPLYNQLGRVNKFVINHQQESKNLLRDINLQKKRITNQLLLEQQRQQKYNNIPIQKFDTMNPLSEQDINYLPQILTPLETNSTSNDQQENQKSLSKNSSEYWTSKRYFIPMYSYLQSVFDDEHQHNH